MKAQLEAAKGACTREEEKSKGPLNDALPLSGCQAKAR